jgi:broad specificity phosphatase PhoE
VQAYGDSAANLLLVAHGGLYRLMLSRVLVNVELAFAAAHPLGYTEVVVAETRPEGLVALEWCGEEM